MAVGDPEADRHHKKNAPNHPPGHEPQDFPPYEYREFPRYVHHEKEEPRLVKDEAEMLNFLSRGWAKQPHEAKAALQAYELEKSDNAAQRASDDRRMSDKAKAEHEAADSAAEDHVLDLPAGKLDKKKTGRD